MFISSESKLTFSRFFLQPANTLHRQYEALRAYFVEGLPSREAAARFGYTPGSFRGLVHRFRQEPDRSFFQPVSESDQPDPPRDDLRQHVIALRKQNFSIYDISQALAREGLSLSPVAVNTILKEEGFARLPRRLDEERLPGTRPTCAGVADVQQFDLRPQEFHTKFGGLFLFLPTAISTPSLNRLVSQVRPWSLPAVLSVLCSP